MNSQMVKSRPLFKSRALFPSIITLIFVAFIESSILAQERVEPEDFLTLWAGTLPIILSAPHGGRHAIPKIPERRGIGIKHFVAGRDSNTDDLALGVALKLQDQLGEKPFLVIAHFERKFLDANRSRESAYESEEAKPYYDAYHRALLNGCERVRKEWGWGLLLDIHGQGSHSEVIFRGTHNGQSVFQLTKRFGSGALTGSKSVLGQMAQRGYKVLPGNNTNEREERYVGGYIIQTYGSHQGTDIDAIQLEFGTRLRSQSNLSRTAADLADAIVVFAREYLPLRRTSREQGDWSKREWNAGVME